MSFGFLQSLTKMLHSPEKVADIKQQDDELQHRANNMTAKAQIASADAMRTRSISDHKKAAILHGHAAEAHEDVLLHRKTNKLDGQEESRNAIKWHNQQEDMHRY